MKPEHSMLDSFNNNMCKCCVCKEYFDKEKHKLDYIVFNEKCITCSQKDTAKFLKISKPMIEWLFRNSKK